MNFWFLSIINSYSILNLIKETEFTCFAENMTGFFIRFNLSRYKGKYCIYEVILETPSDNFMNLKLLVRFARSSAIGYLHS